MRNAVRGLRPIARAAVVAAGVLALASASACGDDDGLAPISPRDVAGTYVTEGRTEGELFVVDTVRIYEERFGSWVTSARQAGGEGVLHIYRSFRYELRANVLGLLPPAPCPDNAFCVPTVELPPMRGVVRNDTLTLWYAGQPPQDGPSYHQFRRVSSAP